MLFLINFFFKLVLILFSICIFFLLDNIIYSIIGFLVVIFNVCILFINLRIEFLTYIILIVYFGAIAILFLFIIMLVPIKIKSQKNFDMKLNILFSIFFFKLLLFDKMYEHFYHLKQLLFFYIAKTTDSTLQFEVKLYDIFFFKADFFDYSNGVIKIGILFFTEYFFYLQLIGIILLFSILSVLLLIIKYKKFSFIRIR